MKFVKLFRSPNPEKKLRVRLVDDDGKFHHVDFGAKGYNDYTRWPPSVRDKHKLAYIARHKSREDWGLSGILTSGFWSRWILWNLPTVSDSVADVKKRFNI